MTTQLNILQNRINEQDERIRQLEVRLRQSTANLTAIIADGSEINAEATCVLRRHADEQAKRIEKLEIALRNTVCSLIDSNIPMLSKHPRHSILDDELVWALNDIYHQLKE